MASRSYNNLSRKNAQAETARRIIDATVGLHAEKGGMATTHADIAERAGVSVATVYKHFPSREALLPHCMGAVESVAPALDAERLLAIPDKAQRIGALVRGLHDRYRYLHPWIRWTPGDAAALPGLAAAMRERQQQTEQLIRTVLRSCADEALGPDRLALACLLLDYPAWQRIDAELREPDAVARAIEQVVTLLIFQSTACEG